MVSDRNPDWQAPFTLGMWQICYHVDSERHLSFSRGGGRQAPSNPAREWLLVVMWGTERDFAAEERVRALPELTGLWRPCNIEAEEYLALLEKDIDFVVERVREAFQEAPLPAGG
jgi:hypothetical protein